MSVHPPSKQAEKPTAPFVSGTQPSTPPHPPYADLPTPPTSHIEISATTRPGDGAMAGSEPDTNGAGGQGADADHSPTAFAVARKAERASVATASASRQLKEVVESSPSTAAPSTCTSEEAVRVLAEVPRRSTRKNDTFSTAEEAPRRYQRGLEGVGSSGEREEPAMRGEDDNDDESDRESERSRTPSPILGLQPRRESAGGHLGLGASLGPSAEEIYDLVYGDEEIEELEEVASSGPAGKVDVDVVISRLEEMGLGGTSAGSKGQAVVDMVRSLGHQHAVQERLNMSLKQALHSTRVRAISTLSSLRAQYITSLSNVELQTSLLESELEGARAQAKMLGAMLARSEARNEEMDRERAMSVEEEIQWQEAVKGHAEAWRQQQAARASLAAGPPGTTGQQSAQSTVTANQAGEGAGTRSANESAQVLQEPFEMGPKRSPGSKPQPVNSPLAGGDDVTGLGISSMEAGTDATRADEQVSSPISIIIKERNKLLNDKRYLRQRVRDAEAQRERLEQELRAIRPLLVQGGTRTPSAMYEAVMNASVGDLTTPGRVSKRDRGSRRKKVATMGDAEAEHLILAARRFRQTQRQESKAKAAEVAASTATTAGEVDSSTAANDPPDTARDALEAPTTPSRRRTSQDPTSTDPSDSTSPLLPQTPKTPRMSVGITDGQSFQTPRSGRKMADALGLNEPPLAHSGPSTHKLERWGGHERTDSSASVSSFNGASGIDELLSAAQAVQSPEERERQSVLAQQQRAAAAGAGSPKREIRADQPYQSRTPRGHPPPAPMPIKAGTGLHESPKRRRVSSTALDLDRMRFGSSYSMSPEKRGMGFAGSSARRNRTHTEGAEPLSSQSSSGAIPTQSSSALSALDLLADQAAASQQPSQSSDNSPSGDGGNDDGFEDDDQSADEGMSIDGEERAHLPPRSPFSRGGTSLVGFASPGLASAGYPSRYGQLGAAYSYPHSPGGHSGGPPPLHSPGTRHPPALPYGPYAPRGVSPPGGRHAPLGASAYAAAGQPPPSPVLAQPSSSSSHVMQGHHALHHGLSPSSRHPMTPLSPSMATSRHMVYAHVPRLPGDIYEDASQSPSVLNPPTTPKSHSISSMPVTPGTGSTPKPKGGNTSPDKRLPYVRWSEEEDRKLRKAIGQHGQRWEAVARDVGSRSYHQCRQRYLLMRRKEAAKTETA